MSETVYKVTNKETEEEEIFDEHEFEDALFAFMKIKMNGEHPVLAVVERFWDGCIEEHKYNKTINESEVKK